MVLVFVRAGWWADIVRSGFWYLVVAVCDSWWCRSIWFVGGRHGLCMLLGLVCFWFESCVVAWICCGADR